MVTNFNLEPKDIAEQAVLDHLERLRQRRLQGGQGELLGDSQRRQVREALKRRRVGAPQQLGPQRNGGGLV